MFNPNMAVPAYSDVRILLQQNAYLQYELQSTQAQVHALQQELQERVARDREMDRDRHMFKERYNIEKEHNKILQKQVIAQNEDLRLATAKLNEYAQRDIEGVKRMQKEKQNAAFTKSTVPYEGSAYKDAAPSLRGLKRGPSAATPRPDPGYMPRYTGELPVNASFRGLNIGANGNSRRLTSNHNRPLGVTATIGVSQNSQRSFADSVNDLSGPSLIVYSSEVNSEKQQFGREELPEDVPGTFAHDEKMMVKFKSREETLKEITQLFEALAAYIARWAHHYIRPGGPIELNEENGQNSEENGQKSGETKGRQSVMRNCMSPLQGEKAVQYAIRAANSQYTRWFVIAMIWKYLEKMVLHPLVLLGLIPNTMDHVVQVEKELRRTRPADIAPSRREKLIYTRITSVNKILHHPSYKAFRNSKVKKRMAELRGILEPFLIPRGQISHQTAAEELNQIGLKAFTLLTQTLNHDGLVQIQGAGIGSTFQESHMRLASCHHGSPSALSGKVKIRLCVSPGVVFREDTAGNVFAKQIMKPMVVVEEKEPRGPPAALQ